MIKVMIVDDSMIMRRNLRLILEKFSQIEIVGEADNGEKAVELFQQCNPDIITMDIAMPGLDGIGAVKAIRSINDLVKIIVVSSLNQKKKVFQAIDAGADFYITKPYSVDSLKINIEQAMGVKL